MRRSSTSARTSWLQAKKEYTANHFTYAELEENEVDLVKLKVCRFSRGAGPRRIRRRRPLPPTVSALATG